MHNKTNDFKALLPVAHKAIHRWYKAFGRHDLPWRNINDPYVIYISEVMLQQTQVKTVLMRYYAPFLKRFPTLAALAKASQQEVMKAWEGLGYYSRAANLHKAARQAGKALPKTVEELLALPGIGRNTAHAVAAFAYGIPVPVMEANVKRVLCRVFALLNPDANILWEKAELLLDKNKPFDYNQAMMDIGALICTKRNPACERCPLTILCKGQVSPERYPAAKHTKQVPVRKRTIVIFYDVLGYYYLNRRETRFLGGLYGFMEYEENAKDVEFEGKRYSLTRKQLLGAINQAYSHFTLDAKVYRVLIGGKIAVKEGMMRTKLAKIADLPLSRADQKILTLLRMV